MPNIGFNWQLSILILILSLQIIWKLDGWLLYMMRVWQDTYIPRIGVSVDNIGTHDRNFRSSWHLTRTNFCKQSDVNLFCILTSLSEVSSEGDRLSTSSVKAFTRRNTDSNFSAKVWSFILFTLSSKLR